MTDLPPPTSPDSRRRSLLPRLVVGLLVAGVAAYGGFYAFWRFHLKRFQVVAPGVFYRVAQPTEFGLRHVVQRYRIRTVVSLQLFDFKLYAGLFDPGNPDGRQETDYVRALGLRPVQWPMGDEQCWPWPTPWQFEEFFRLVDDPANHPILIHCMGGRHRTGTLAALYRLEYDRWNVDAALDEMYSFDFGLGVPVQEFNLRTYVPRPRPTEAELRALRSAFEPVLNGPIDDYSGLVRTLRRSSTDARVRKALVDYLCDDGSFGVSLAARLVDDPTDPAAAVAAEAAWRRLQDPAAAETEWTSAAAVVADFGSDDRRRTLLDRLRKESATDTPSRFYDAVVRGVSNRYTENRLAFLKPVLDDRRERRNDASGVRYCDVALVRIAAITDTLGMRIGVDPQTLRLTGHDLAHAWFAQHPEAAQLVAFAPPQGRKIALAGEAPLEEDLSKLRR